MSLVKRKLLKISSADRDNRNAETTDFTITIRNNILQNIKAVSLKHMTFKNLHTNIQPWNNTFVIYTGLLITDNIGDGSAYETNKQEITIPIGQYSLDEIISVLETELNNALSETYWVTKVGDDRIDISSDGYFAILKSDDDIKNPSNPLGKILGFTKDLPQASLSYSTTDLGAPILGGLESVYLHSNISQSHTIEYRGNNSDIFTVVPVSVSFGNTVIFQSDFSNENLIVFPNLLELNELYFRLSDSRGNTIDIQGHDIEMVFELLY